MPSASAFLDETAPSASSFLDEEPADVPSLDPQVVTPEDETLPDRIKKFLFEPEGAKTLREGIQGAVEAIPHMAVDTAKMGYKGLRMAMGGPEERTKILTEDVIPSALAQGQQTAADIQSPFGTKEWLRGAGQVGMMALPGLELARELRAPVEPTLAERITQPRVEPAPEEPLAPVTPEVPPEKLPATEEKFNRETLKWEPKEDRDFWVDGLDMRQDVVNGLARLGVDVTKTDLPSPEHFASGKDFFYAMREADAKMRQSGAKAAGFMFQDRGYTPPETPPAPEAQPVAQNRFVLNPHGGVFDTIYNQTVTPAATHPDVSAAALKALNESELNGKFVNPVSMAADAAGNPIFISDALPEPIKVSPLTPEAPPSPPTQADVNGQILEKRQGILARKKELEARAANGEQVDAQLAAVQADLLDPSNPVVHPPPKPPEATVQAPGDVPVAETPPEPYTPEAAAARAAQPEAPPSEPIGGNVAGFEKVYGPGEIPAGETISPEDAWDTASARAQGGKAQPYGFVDRARTGAITPEEMGDLIYEHHRLVERAAGMEGTPEYTEASQAAKDFAQNVLKPAETAWHQKGMVMQIERPVNLNTFTGMDQLMQTELGRGIKPSEAPKFTRMAEDIKNGESEVVKAVERSDARVRTKYAKVRDIPIEEAVARVKQMLKDCM